MVHRPHHKQWIFLLSFLLSFVFFTLFLFYYSKDQREFTNLTTTLFKNELSQNALNLHYTLAYPENYGIFHYQTSLPCYQSSDKNMALMQLENYKRLLSQIDASNLNKNDQYTYLLLSRYLDTAMTGSSFFYYKEPFSPASGMQSQFPILMAEYSFRTTTDVEDYLNLLASTKNYFSSLLLYEKEKKQAGLFMPYNDACDVSKQCNVILSKSELQKGTHFLQTTFSERLLSLKEKNLLSENQMNLYLEKNNEILFTIVEPAYCMLSKSLLSLADKSITAKGLCHLPEGKNYYTYLLKQNTGSYLTVPEIKKLLYSKFDKEVKYLTELCTKNSNILSQNSNKLSSDFPYTLPDEMLEDLKTRMKNDFPNFPINKKTAPAYTVKNVSKNLEDYSSPAFYFTPPLDDFSQNIIYINQKNSPKGIELYTTLAHEGYPGHLYQSVYSHMHMTNTKDNLVRQLLWYGGYLEGWALYVEFGAYDYAANLAKEHGQTDAAILYSIEKHNRSLQLCLYAILDIAIHYDGADYQKVHKILSSFGIHDPKTTLQIYEYIASEPTNYLKYYLGYLEVLQLKEKAKTLWQDSYTDYRFHKFYLESGPSDFVTLSEALINENP